jgi:hypothetical protein
MILSPDDHRSLQAIDGELATCEPHLAAMFRIFTKLNAEEAPPPTEDLIVARPPAVPAADALPQRSGWRERMRRQAAQAQDARSQVARSRAARSRVARSRAAQARLAARGRAGSRPRDVWGPVAAIAVPMVLLVTLVVVVFVGLSGTVKCQPTPAASGAKTSVIAPGAANLAACRPSPGTAGSSAKG